MTDSLGELINVEGFCRTAPATPGMLIKHLSNKCWQRGPGQFGVEEMYRMLVFMTCFIYFFGGKVLV